MSERFLVIEITGEPGFQKTLCQSGWSGRDYPFFYNRHPDPKKCSHIRAYRSLDIYLAERVDMHKAANVWPLMPNFFTADEIEPQCWTTPLPEGPAAVRFRPSEPKEKPKPGLTVFAKPRKGPSAHVPMAIVLGAPKPTPSREEPTVERQMDLDDEITRLDALPFFSLKAEAKKLGVVIAGMDKPAILDSIRSHYRADV